MSLSQSWARLLLLTFVALLVASCTARPLPPPVNLPYGDLDRIDPRNQVITFWHPYTHTQEEALLDLVDTFNATNPWHITVVGESAGSFGALYRAVEGRLESGLLPDLSLAEPHQVAAYVARQALVELTPYAEHRTWGLHGVGFIHTTTLPQFEGLYSLPSSRAVELLYYNDDWLYELGYPEPPRTWDAFQEMACAASDPDAGVYGYTFAIDALTFADMLTNRGGQMLEEGAAGYGFGDASGLETLRFVRALLSNGCASWTAAQREARSDLTAGRALFVIDSITLLPSIRQAVSAGAGFDWSVVPLPTTLEAPRLGIYGDDYVVLRTTPERQLAAWLFIRWMNEPEQQAKWVSSFHTLPTRASTRDLLADYIAQNPQYELVLDMLDYELTAEPAVVGYQGCRRELENLLYAVVRGAEPSTELVRTLRLCNESLQAAASE